MISLITSSTTDPSVLIFQLLLFSKIICLTFDEQNERKHINLFNILKLSQPSPTELGLFLICLPRKLKRWEINQSNILFDGKL
jgi:hypothetical protein